MSFQTTYHETLVAHPLKQGERRNVTSSDKDNDHDDHKHDHNQSQELKKVQIPTSGYYSMSFGTKRHLEEFETIHVASAHENDVPFCGCMFQIHWSNTTSLDTTNTTTSNIHPISTLHLPLTRTPPSSKHKNKLYYITSRRIASILYLAKGTEFHIVPYHSCHSTSFHMTTQNHHQNSISCCCCCYCCGPFEFTLELFMEQDVETRLVKQTNTCYDEGKKHSIQTKEHDGDDVPIQPVENHLYIDFNPIEFRKKPWVCVECKRCFDSPKATRNHYISKHALTSSSGAVGMKRRRDSGEDYSDLIGPEIFHIPLRSVYQDDDIAIIVKPQGVPVQGGRWTLNSTDLLLPFRAPKGTEGSLSKPRTTHRLDSATGGLLVIAKTHESETRMNQLFEMKLCKKRYRAIVFGKLILNQHDYTELDTQVCDDDDFKGFGIIHACVGDKPSLTRYRIVSSTPCSHPLANGFITTVDLWPVTGRTHQLRKHLQMIGHPIWGDLRYASYSKDERNSIRSIKDFNASIQECPHARMCLWALEISFPHPVKSDLTVQAMIEEPKFYDELRESLICDKKKSC